MNVVDTILIGLAVNQLADNQEEYDEIMRDIILGEVEVENEPN